MSLKFHEMTIDAYLFLPPERILMISVKKRSSMLPFLNRPALFSWI